MSRYSETFLENSSRLLGFDLIKVDVANSVSNRYRLIIATILSQRRERCFVQNVGSGFASTTTLKWFGNRWWNNVNAHFEINVNYTLNWNFSMHLTKSELTPRPPRLSPLPPRESPFRSSLLRSLPPLPSLPPRPPRPPLPPPPPRFKSAKLNSMSTIFFWRCARWG